MGMFAASETNTRYAKIYLTFADGRRQPRSQYLSATYLLSMVAIIFYLVNARERPELVRH